MMHRRSLYIGGMFLSVTVALSIWHPAHENAAPAQAQTPPGGVPAFQLDPAWPKLLPHSWILGMVASLTVESRDHVWIIHRAENGATRRHRRPETG